MKRFDGRPTLDSQFDLRRRRVALLVATDLDKTMSAKIIQMWKKTEKGEEMEGQMGGKKTH